MTDDVIRSLRSKDNPSATSFHGRILDHAKGLVAMSRTAMARRYSDWDMQDEVFRGIRYLDSDDRAQARKGQPTKMVVPNTFAQVMTFASFLFLMYKQNRTFFELQPTGNEDYGQKGRDIEQILERDLRHNQWSTVLFQHLLDVGRFGPAVNECCWTRKISRIYAPAESKVVNYNAVDVTVRGGSGWQDYVKYEGNLVRNVSPYRFFPDTRFPMTEFQRGEFCAAEEEYSMASLRELESVGEVAGIDNIEPLPTNWKEMRGAITRTVMPFDATNKFLLGPSPSQSEGTVIVTKSQNWIVPKHFELEVGKHLGPEEFPVLYHLWYANDNRVIRLEPAYWWHNEFGWTMSQFTPDMHHTVSLGLADLIYRLQDVISWHINARITDVRRNMRGRLILDPEGVMTSSVDGDGDIYLRKGAGKAGIDRWIKALNMSDVTAGHMADADMLGKIMEVVTGVNSNAMGQYNTGRRSARETSVVTAGSSGRMKMHAHLIWDTGLGPLGKQMMSNSRQNLTMPEFTKAVGGDPAMAQQRYAEFKGTPEEVVTGDDYFMFDSTLQSEKGYIAQALQELLVAVIGNPAAAQQLDIDPRQLMSEIQFLRGSGNVGRFSLSKQVAGGASPLPPVTKPPEAVLGSTGAPQLGAPQGAPVPQEVAA